MWLHKNLEWWGFVIGIVTFIGAIPMGVLSNLATPRLQNWWATRSRESLQQRIAKLEVQLVEMEAREPITAIESYTLQKIEQIEDALSPSVHLLLTTIFFAVLATTSEFQRPWGYWFIGFIVFAMAFNLARGILKDKPSTNFRLPERESSLKEAITKLKSELATKSLPVR